MVTSRVAPVDKLLVSGAYRAKVNVSIRAAARQDRMRAQQALSRPNACANERSISGALLPQATMVRAESEGLGFRKRRPACSRSGHGGDKGEILPAEVTI